MAVPTFLYHIVTGVVGKVQYFISPHKKPFYLATAYYTFLYIDNYPGKLRKHRKLFTFLCVLVMFLIDIPMITKVSILVKDNLFNCFVYKKQKIIHKNAFP